MGLPGSQTSALSEDAKTIGDFGTHLFNGHGNLEFVEAIRELRNIVGKLSKTKGFISWKLWL